MFRLDDATEQGVKYQKRFYKADERCKTLGVRVSDLQSTIAELKEKFQVSAEHISCLQKSALDIPSSFSTNCCQSQGLKDESRVS